MLATACHKKPKGVSNFNTKITLKQLADFLLESGPVLLAHTHFIKWNPLRQVLIPLKARRNSNTNVDIEVLVVDEEDGALGDID